MKPIGYYSAGSVTSKIEAILSDCLDSFTSSDIRALITFCSAPQNTVRDFLILECKRFYSADALEVMNLVNQADENESLQLARYFCEVANSR